jgi:hypothetical protein
MHFELRALVCAVLLFSPAFAFHATAINNDGNVDILWRNAVARALRTWVLNPDLTGRAVGLDPARDLPWKLIGMADCNRDGQLDLIWYLPENGHVAYWYMSGTAMIGAFDLANATPALWQTAPRLWDLIGAGYFSGADDKSPDLLWLNQQNGTLAVWEMNDTTITRVTVLVNQSGEPVRILPPWQFATVGDYGHDGHTDIFLRDMSQGQVAVWSMNGPISTGTILLPPEPLVQWRLVAADQFNPDTDAHVDLLWRDTATGAMRVWLMAGNSRSNTVPVFAPEQLDLNWTVGGVGDAFVDADRDGMPDLWERNHFGHLSRNGTADRDLDGYADAEEFRNGTNPTVPDTPLFKIGQSFAGLHYGEVPTHAVPDVMGAIGPTEFMEVLNGRVKVYKRANPNLTSEMTLDAFFNGAQTLDPRVWFDNIDTNDQHWVACAIDRGSVPPRVILKVSHGPSGSLDPSNWYRHARDIPVQGTELLDFPTLGVDKNGYYISVQRRASTVNQGFYVQCYKKPAVFSNSYSTLPPLLTVPPTSPVTKPHLAPLDTWVIQPCYNFDPDLPTNGPAWLVAKGSRNPSEDPRTLVYRRIQWNGSNPAWVEPAWQAVEGNYLDYYDIPQGSTVLAPRSGVPVNLGLTGSRLLTAVLRNGQLWTCHHVGLDGTDKDYDGPGDPDRSAIQWFKLLTGPAGLTYASHDRIASLQARNPYWFYFPSLNVNAQGDVLFGFSGSRHAEPMAAFALGRTSAGISTPQPLLLHIGRAELTFRGYGDYSATTIDPLNDSFWTVQQFDSFDEEAGRVWATWISQILLGP